MSILMGILLGLLVLFGVFCIWGVAALIIPSHDHPKAGLSVRKNKGEGRE